MRSVFARFRSWIAGPALRGWALPLALLLVVLGSKWTVVHRFGSSIPEWDQWDAEGLHLFLPWESGNLTLAELFRPHNEHRVVLTKLLSLVLLILNGQWDSRLQCAVNAVLHSGLAVGLFLLGRRHFSGRWQGALFLLIAAFFAPPLAWQNNLGGFHSQQYFLLGLSCLALWLLAGSTPDSRRWWLGLTAAALAMLSMGSGFFAAAAFLPVLAVAWWRGEVTPREAWPTAAACAALCLVGWLTRVEVDYHASLKARTLHDFLQSILLSLQWPAPRSAALAALVWFPWAMVAWRGLRRNRQSWEGGAILLGLGIWVLLQIVATAYARGAGGSAPASRYLDTLGFGAVINGICLGFLLRTSDGTGRRLVAVLAAGWTLITAWGVSNVARHNLLSDLPSVRVYLEKAEAHVRSYLETDNLAHLEAGDLPYPGRDALVERLAHPELRGILPPVIRLPLPFRAALRESGFDAFDPLKSESADGRGPPALGRPYWSSHKRESNAGPATWDSTTFSVRSGRYLQFRVAGSTDLDGIGLEIRDGTSSKVVGVVPLGQSTGNTWHTAYIRLPAGTYFLSAHDRNAQGWLAFSQPVEVGRLSYWAPRFIRQGGLLSLGGAVVGLVALAVGWISSCPTVIPRPESRSRA